MAEPTFSAVVLRDKGGQVSAAIETLGNVDLPKGDVQVAIDYSSLNYKDALAITGAGKVVRTLPMIPGIDLAGTVEKSTSPQFNRGDKVILTGWGLGESWWGGFAERAAVQSEWLIPNPHGMTPKQAMGFGTAGFTAALAIDSLEQHGLDKTREILVTGAAGGVGSVAIAMLARLGYRIVASTGRLELKSYLEGLGAESVIARDVLSMPAKPFQSERWGAVIDTVGGQTLASATAAVCERGAIAVCGMTGGTTIPASVLPFILRGVIWLGIESVRCPARDRARIWSRLASTFPDGLPGNIVHEIPLEDVFSNAEAFLSGTVRGRTVVRVRG
ncbi:TPA: oxidoreductase [Burkholderia cenocepacia]|nr:oxidoreductase [Burkholderia cenocepacia]